MKHFLTVIFLLICCVSACAQGTGGGIPGPQLFPIQFVSSIPTSCPLNRLIIVRSSGAQYMSILGACTQVGSGSGGTVPSTVQGDILYASAANTLSALAKSTSATRYLSNTGTSNNPAWAQINAANGLTGTTPVANGGTGAATLTGILQGNGTSAFTPATATNVESPLFCSDAGANDTYACSLSPAIAAYATGTHYRFKANTANTGAASINFNAKGAVTIVKVAGGITTALADNDVRAGQWVDVVYDGTNMQMQSLLGNAPSAGITGSLTATHVPVATGASALGDSRIIDTGTEIGIADDVPGPVSINNGDSGANGSAYFYPGDPSVTIRGDSTSVLALADNTGITRLGDIAHTTNLVIDAGAAASTLSAGTESLAIDGVAHTITQTAASGITLDSGAGSFTAGDVNNAAGRTTLTISDTSKSIAFNAAAGALNLVLPGTVTAGGTVGAQTINKTSGSVNFAAAATSLVVTNSLVGSSSLIFCTVATNDATMKSVQCVAGSGSFTIFANAAAGSETRVNFLVINQ